MGRSRKSEGEERRYRMSEVGEEGGRCRKKGEEKMSEVGGRRSEVRCQKSVPLVRCLKSKRGQEEMVGFALIIIIVAVVLLVFLSISLRDTDREIVASFEIESFIQSFLQHTSECRRSDNLDFLSVQRLIFSCNEGDLCLDGQDSCEVLNETLIEIMDESWKIGEDRPVKGRKLEILSNGQELFYIEEGNITQSSMGAVQEFFRSGSEISINFVVYY